MAAFALGKNGPDLANVEFAVDSSGTGPLPPPPSPQPSAPAAPPASTPAPPPPAPTVKVGGTRKTKRARPVFTFDSDTADASFICRIGVRANTRSQPCRSPFRVPDLGPGRHVLVVQAIGADGIHSHWVKYAYYVEKKAK